MFHARRLAKDFEYLEAEQPGATRVLGRCLLIFPYARCAPTLIEEEGGAVLTAIGGLRVA